MLNEIYSNFLFLFLILYYRLLYYIISPSKAIFLHWIRRFPDFCVDFVIITTVDATTYMYRTWWLIGTRWERNKSTTNKKTKTQSFFWTHLGPRGLSGGGGDFDPVHRAVDGGPDAQHAAGAAGRGRRGRDDDGQPQFGDGGGRVHNVVHARVPAALRRLAEQVEILQGGAERDRLAGHFAVLHLAVAHRDQEQFGPVPGRAPGRTDLPHHADPAHFEIGAPLDRPAEPRLHVAQLVQGARPVDALPGHGRPHLLVALLFRRERRTGFKVHQHSWNLLVGRNHHDDGRLRWYLSGHTLREGYRKRLLHLRSTGHCLAHPHRRQQFYWVLQESNAEGEGAEAQGGPGAGKEGGQHRLIPPRQPEGRLRQVHGHHRRHRRYRYNITSTTICILSPSNRRLIY